MVDKPQMNVSAMLSDLADAGGEKVVVEGYYGPSEGEAYRLGLITVEPFDGGMGCRERVTLTRKGRWSAGLPAVMSPPRAPNKRKLLGFLDFLRKP